MKNNAVFGIALIGLVALFMFQNKPADTLSVAEKRRALKDKVTATSSNDGSVFDQMTDQEVNDVYLYIFSYVVKQKPAPDWLKQSMNKIGAKYNIFT